MRPSVASNFIALSEPLEGRTTWPYLDVRGLVTVGVGCLIDPVGLALPLRWRLPTGALASPTQVEAEWLRVKIMRPGRVASAYRGALELDPASIDALLLYRLRANAGMLRGSFDGWDDWPADAQLGALSLSWAVGAGWPRGGEWPNTTAACKRRDWRTVAAEAVIDTTGNPGIVPRNVEQRIAFTNAAAVEGNAALDPAECYWPLELVS